MIREITSKDNKKIKQWNKLLRKKYRNQEGLFLAEGPNLIVDGILAGYKPKAIVFSKEKALDEVLQKQGQHLSDLEVYRTSGEIISLLEETQHSQGIIGIFSKPSCKVEDFCKYGRSSNWLYLDRLQDPGNIGTLIRTADAGNFGGVLISKETADIFSGKVLRSTAGSIFRIPIITDVEYGDLFNLGKEYNKKIIVSCFEDSIEYTSCPMGEDSIVVIGNEGNGVSETLINKADYRVSIPMFNGVESLNASVAGAILIYESQRQNRFRKEELIDER